MIKTELKYLNLSLVKGYAYLHYDLQQDDHVLPLMSACYLYDSNFNNI